MPVSCAYPHLLSIPAECSEGRSHYVVLYDDEVTPRDRVVRALAMLMHIGQQRAEMYVSDVECLGSAVVYCNGADACEYVARQIISLTGARVEVVQS